MFEKIHSFLAGDPTISISGSKRTYGASPQHRRPYHSSQQRDFSLTSIIDPASPSPPGDRADPNNSFQSDSSHQWNAIAASDYDETAGKRSLALPTVPTVVTCQEDKSFLKVMHGDPVDLATLRQLSWQGCPDQVRADVWMLLTGHWHSHLSQRGTILERKRQEYLNYVQANYGQVDWDAACASADLGTDMGSSATFLTSVNGEAILGKLKQRGEGSLDGSATTVPRPSAQTPLLSVRVMAGSTEAHILKQIRKDIPRMSGGLPWLSHPRVQQSLERILFIWALRHPACGYVQGINDLITPFFAVLLAAEFCPNSTVTELEASSQEVLNALWSEDAVSSETWMSTIEADTYWASSYILNVMQDNYTHEQCGITKMMRKMEDVVRAADEDIYVHLTDALELDFSLFAFRWVNCLLLRELTASQGLRLLDAYLSNAEKQWSTEHVYVCAALLLRWSGDLIHMHDFVTALTFLQNPPTVTMSSQDMDAVLSEGYLLQCLYESSSIINGSSVSK